MAGWKKLEGTEALAVILASQHLVGELSPHVEAARAAKEIKLATPASQAKQKQTI